MPYIKDFYFSKEVIINKRFHISKFSVGILSNLIQFVRMILLKATTKRAWMQKTKTIFQLQLNAVPKLWLRIVLHVKT